MRTALFTIGLALICISASPVFSQEDPLANFKRHRAEREAIDKQALKSCNESEGEIRDQCLARFKELSAKMDAAEDAYLANMRRIYEQSEARAQQRIERIERRELADKLDDIARQQRNQPSGYTCTYVGNGQSICNPM